MMVFQRTNSQRCPYCVGIRATRENCLATKYPKLSKEWNKTKIKSYLHMMFYLVQVKKYGGDVIKIMNGKYL